MREDLRRNLLAQKVVEKEVGEKIAVTDQDITAFFEANKAQFNRTEDAVHIAQIVVTPVREQQRTNRTGDDAVDAAGGDGEGADADGEVEGRRDVRRPRRGLFGGSASRRSVAAISASCRCRRCSRRRRQLRDAVLKSAPGTVQLVSQGGAHTIVLTIARDTKGQKDLSMPSVKDAITHDAEGPQGTVDPRRLPHQPAQRRDRSRTSWRRSCSRRRARCRRARRLRRARSRRRSRPLRS